MLDIYVDADACPVKEEILRVAMRHTLRVYLVSNSRLNMNVDINVHKVVVGFEPDAADDWIVQHIQEGDIVVTIDILLADRCLKHGARVISSTGKIFNHDTIGAAKALRELRAYLRETNQGPSYNAVFSQKDRSHFLKILEETIQALKRQK